jgi:hypothetical protein
MCCCGRAAAGVLLRVYVLRVHVLRAYYCGRMCCCGRTAADAGVCAVDAYMLLRACCCRGRTAAGVRAAAGVLMLVYVMLWVLQAYRCGSAAIYIYIYIWRLGGGS